MEETAMVMFYNQKLGMVYDLEIPLSITANDLIVALNEAYNLGMDVENIFNCYFKTENPIAFLRGNKLLSDFNVRNGTLIQYTF